MWNTMTGSATLPPTLTLEWAPFTLVAGVDEATLRAASDALQTEFLKEQPGFVRRELIRGQDNQWVDVVYWRSRADADQATIKIADSPVCHRYFSLMAGMTDANHADPAAGVSYFEQIASYTADDTSGRDAVALEPATGMPEGGGA